MSTIDENSLRKIFDSSFDEIFVTDSQGVVLLVNSACERLYDIPAAQLIGKRVNELEQEGVFTPSVTPLVLKEKKRITIIQETRTGRKIIVTGNPVFDAKGKVVFIVYNSRDITELLTAGLELESETKAASKALSDLSYISLECEEEKPISCSTKMKEILSIAERIARVDSAVLILGESGVGKEVVARYIHNHSYRNGQAFVPINCSAIPEQLLESELFGYEGGAFTGARKQGKKGLLELANGGTVFFDEIAELPLNLQAKLLRVIQSQRLVRVGGTSQIRLDVRIMSATNDDLAKLVKQKKFRDDLYYRINVIPVEIPPLRERKEDIYPLVMHFLSRFNKKYRTEKRITKEAMDLLIGYDWPGNVREVGNMVERVAAMTIEDDILAKDLPEKLLTKGTFDQGTVFVHEIMPLKQAVASVEKQLMLRAYKESKSTYAIAERLGISQSSAVRKLNKYFGDVKERLG